MAKRKNTRYLQQNFLKEFPKKGFRVKPTCEVVGISRDTYYEWKNNDADFAAELTAINEDWKDNIVAIAYEEAAIKRNTALLVKFLEGPCKDRGFGREQKIQMQGEMNISGIEVTIVRAESGNSAGNLETA